MAAPCLLAAVALAVVLHHRALGLGAGRIAAWSALVLVAANPLTLRALEVGHPEELLGGALCVGAGLAAVARRPLLAGALLGAAMANKPWAVVAVAPVLLMLGDGRRRALACAVGVAALLVAPMLLLSGGRADEHRRHRTHQRSDLPALGAVVVPRRARPPRDGPLRRARRLSHAGAVDHARQPSARESSCPSPWRCWSAGAGASWPRRRGSPSWPSRCSCAGCSTPGTRSTTRCPACLALVAWEVHARRPPMVALFDHGAELGLVRAAAQRGQPRSAGRLLPGVERAAGLRARAGCSCARRAGAPTR